MRKSVIRLVTITALAAFLSLPAAAFAAEAEKGAGAPPEAPPVKPSHVKLETEGEFTSLQIGKTVYVYNADGQLFQTSGKGQKGSFQDLFVLPYGPAQVPFVLVKNDEGLKVFSDLWPEFTKDDKAKAEDTVEAYDSGRVFYTAQAKIVSKTGHHYAEQDGDEVVAYTANDFSDLDKGFHESIRVQGKLRGLILYDCCPYAVVEDKEGNVLVYHAGENGPIVAGSIDL
ncbi:hypothetical protein [Gorillibacterium sp. sgz5001074]|uniref:hypothetical protein n=1 Tax=Gorillibacterium sp. sgz5001074 TaxID=3446695 RepID=UPI003F670630